VVSDEGILVMGCGHFDTYILYMKVPRYERARRALSLCEGALVCGCDGDGGKGGSVCGWVLGFSVIVDISPYLLWSFLQFSFSGFVCPKLFGHRRYLVVFTFRGVARQFLLCACVSKTCSGLLCGRYLAVCWFVLFVGFSFDSWWLLERSVATTFKFLLVLLCCCSLGLFSAP